MDTFGIDLYSAELQLASDRFVGSTSYANSSLFEDVVRLTLRCASCRSSTILREMKLFRVFFFKSNSLGRIRLSFDKRRCHRMRDDGL